MKRLSLKQKTLSCFLHPSALCESTQVGGGTRIWAFAHVMAGARIGRDCNIGDHAFIESGAVVGDRVTIKNHVMVWEGVSIEEDAFIGPGAIFTNDEHPRSPRMSDTAVTRRYAKKNRWLVSTRVGRGASIGAGAVILPGIVVGAYSLVGAGAVVRRSVSPHAMIVGNPGRQIGWVCRCGQKLRQAGRQFKCAVCRRTYAISRDRLVGKRADV